MAEGNVFNFLYFQKNNYPRINTLKTSNDKKFNLVTINKNYL